MKKLILFLPFMFSLSVLLAQEQISAGNKYAVFSQVLNEDRPYWVHLPQNYHQKEYGQAQYPVIYLLDGDQNFFTQLAVQAALTQGMYRYMPEMIIVGIINTDRSRDLTPTRSQLIHKGKALHQNSGGAENFYRFLTSELRPEIDSTYRTNGYNLLAGHSFGGLFTLFCLLDHTQAFQTYIAHDPSLWWDNRRIFQQAVEKWDTLNLSGINLYISLAHPEEKDTDRQKHFKAIHDFCTRFLSGSRTNGLRGRWKYFECEDHGTVFLPASYDAMKFIYEGLCLPVKEIPDNPGIIRRHYKKVASNIGYPVIPEEELIDNIGNYCISLDQTDPAKRLFQMNLENYPDSPNANGSMAKLYLRLGYPDLAKEFYRRAAALNPEYGKQLRSTIRLRQKECEPHKNN